MAIHVNHISFALAALTLLSHLVTAEVAVVATSLIVSSYSSILYTPAATPTTSFCCGDDCPPQACDVNRVVPTDLAFLYPPPLTPSTSLEPTPVTIPCCTNGCADGACRRSSPYVLHFPSTTPPPHPGQVVTIATIGCGEGGACTQGYGSAVLDADDKAATAKVTSPAEVAHKADLAFFNTIQVCAGCGRCTPCALADIVTWASFQPSPTTIHRPHAISNNSTQSVTAPSQPTPNTDGSAELGPIYLAPEVVSAINGLNPDYVPLVVSKGNNPSSSSSNPPSQPNDTTNLITLLALVELKLSENYISRRLLSHLGLLDSIIPFPPTLPPSIAILSAEQERTPINATVLLDLVAGDKDGATQHRFVNVRFQVYGAEPIQGAKKEKIDLPDVIVGAKFMREAGGLTVYQGFRGEVARGIDCVWPVHQGRLRFGGQGDGSGAGEDGGEGQGERQKVMKGHDEL